MVIVYLTSSASRTGKTAVAAALGKHALEQKKQVGYLKPNLPSDKNAQNDAAVMKGFLGLVESIADMAPTFPDAKALEADITNTIGKLQGRDLVIVEGPSGTPDAAARIASKLRAKVLGVEDYASANIGASSHYKGMSTNTVGIILNKIPKRKASDAVERVGSAFAGVRIIGTIAEDRSLYSLTIDELAGRIDASILGSPDRASSPIQNIMVGAMNPDHGPDYYSLRDNKAVVVRADRPDMQLAALETQTAVIVLAGGTPPIAMVTMRAQANRVPLISARSDVKTILQTVETALGNNTLTEAKATLFAALVQEQLDVQTLFKDLGVPG